MLKTVQVVLLVVLLAVGAGCGINKNVKQLVGLGGDEQTAYTGPSYPATSKTAVAFQPGQVPKSCRVFAQALVLLPAQTNGKEIERTIVAEAGKRGADRVLIGQTRESKEKGGPQFLYYGPEREYLCAEQCGGWKFGYTVWEKQGNWIGLGYGEWGKAEASFEVPVLTQLALLRCQ